MGILEIRFDSRNRNRLIQYARHLHQMIPVKIVTSQARLPLLLAHKLPVRCVERVRR